MRVTFVGTGRCIDRPGSNAVANMIEVGNAVYFVDCGAPVADALLRLGKDPASVRAVFTTHCHSDCTAGIFFFADLVNWAWRECTLRVFLTTQAMIAATERLILAALSGGGRIDHDRLSFLLADAGRVYEDELVTVDYISPRHVAKGSSPSYAILLTERASGKRALFSGASPYGIAEDGLPGETIADTDLFVCGLSRQGVAELLPRVAGYGGLLCLEHLGDSDGEAAALVAALSAHGIRAIAPTDGEWLEV